MTNIVSGGALNSTHSRLSPDIIFKRQSNMKIVHCKFRVTQSLSVANPHSS